MIDSARRVYQIFLEKYPSHELATSARFELETLGKDPSSLLRIDTVAAGDAGSPPPARKSGPRQLLSPPRMFVGRTAELARLSQASDVVVVSGAGGIGKTWLALHWAHRDAHRQVNEIIDRN